MRNFFAAIICCLLVTSLHGQYYYDRSKNPDRTVKQSNQSAGRDFDTYYSFSWDFNTPLSNQNFISDNSNLGTKFSIRKRLNNVDGLWVGGDLGWAAYQQHIPFTSYQYGSSAVGAEVFNYTYNYSLTGNIDYLLMPMNKIFVPYAGVGVGLAYIKFAQYYNIYGGTLDSFGLQVHPEVGILVGFKENSSWRIKAAVHYDYASNSGKLAANNFITPGNDDYHGFMNMGFQIGIVKMAW
ncbi:MAG TPA: hypothetical protein VL728_08225 [Cyclobacteriaceae bacterium]|jgi:hypothetical protein|nr:hypothetical protein [Cyclobacteriaceae bacterium]